MVEAKKGEIFYYFIKYSDSKVPGAAILEVERDESSTYGLSVIFIVKKIFTKQYIGSPERIKEGNTISANELQGVGSSGYKGYLFKPRQMIQTLFKNC